MKKQELFDKAKKMKKQAKGLLSGSKERPGLFSRHVRKAEKSK